MEPVPERSWETVASTKPGTAGEAAEASADEEPASFRFQAKKEDAGTPLLRQNATTERPLASRRSMIRRHFRRAGDSSLLMDGKTDDCRLIGKDGVHLSLTTSA